MKVNLECNEKIIAELEDKDTEEEIIEIMDEYKKKQEEWTKKYEQIIKKIDEVSAIIRAGAKDE